LRRWMAGQILARFPGAVCDSADAEALDSPERPLRIRAVFSGAGLMPDDGAFQPGAVAIYDWNAPFADSSRTRPIALPYPLAVSDTVLLCTPGNWEDAVPRSFAGADSCGAGRAAWRWERMASGEWRFARDVQLTAIRVEKRDYAEFRAFLNRIAQADRRVFRFDPGPGSDPGR
jgi:hypothetical protein